MTIKKILVWLFVILPLAVLAIGIVAGYGHWMKNANQHLHRVKLSDAAKCKWLPDEDRHGQNDDHDEPPPVPTRTDDDDKTYVSPGRQQDRPLPPVPQQQTPPGSRGSGSAGSGNYAEIGSGGGSSSGTYAELPSPPGTPPGSQAGSQSGSEAGSSPGSGASPQDPTYVSLRDTSGVSHDSGQSGGSGGNQPPSPPPANPPARRRHSAPARLGDSKPSESKKEEKIFKGKDASISDFPWVVSIGAQRWPHNIMRGYLDDTTIPTTHCTGSLIDQHWVVTAASCVSSPLHTYWVTFGTDCRPELGGLQTRHAQRSKVRHVVRRDVAGFRWFRKEWLPKYVTALWKNEIALLELEVSIFIQSANENPNIKVIPWEQTFPRDTSELQYKEPDLAKQFYFGWGATEQTDAPIRLQMLELNKPPMASPKELKKLKKAAGPAQDVRKHCHHARHLICVQTGKDSPSPAKGDTGGPVAVHPGSRSQNSGQEEGERDRNRPASDWLLVGVYATGINPKEVEPAEARYRPREDIEDGALDLVVGQNAERRGMRENAGDTEVAVSVRLRAHQDWLRSEMDKIRLGRVGRALRAVFDFLHLGLYRCFFERGFWCRFLTNWICSTRWMPAWLRTIYDNLFGLFRQFWRMIFGRVE